MTTSARSSRPSTLAAGLLLGLLLGGAEGIAPARLHAAEAGGNESAVQPAVLTGRAMGSGYRIKYWGAGDATPEAVHEAVEALLAEFDLQFSTYRDDSELSRFNRAAAGEWFAVSSPVALVAGDALRLGRSTEGALDVTVGPVLRLWHFGASGERARRTLKPPTDAAIQAAMQSVGLDHLRVRQDPPALWKDAAGVEVDLSSLAPGYAVDLLVELLQSKGFDNAMVECGGEVRASGARPDGSPWRIGVERAAASGQAALARVVALRNMALTTAGDYHNVRTEGGGRYTHIIDPRTGRALPVRGVAVTVIADRCLEADALDTALMVMGPQEGARWCDAHGVGAMFQHSAEGGKLVVTETRRFSELVRQ